MATNYSCDFCEATFTGRIPQGGGSPNFYSISIKIDGNHGLHKDICRACVDRTGWNGATAITKPRESTSDQLYELLLSIIDEAVDERT